MMPSHGSPHSTPYFHKECVQLVPIGSSMEQVSSARHHRIAAVEQTLQQIRRFCTSESVPYGALDEGGFINTTLKAAYEERG